MLRLISVNFHWYNQTSFQTLKKAAFGYSKEGILKYFNNDPVDYQKEFMILHHRASFPASNGKMITAEIEAAALLRLKAAGTLSGAGFNGIFSPQENDLNFLQFLSNFKTSLAEDLKIGLRPQ